MKNYYKSFTLSLFITTVFLFISNISLYSQATGDYRSAATGNWNQNSTWQRFNGTSWVQSGTPSSSDGVITIQSGHVVTIANVSPTVDQMTINSGGQVTVNNLRTLTIANGIGTDLTVNGSLVNSGTLTINASAAISFGSGSIYQHNKDGGTIPTATWATTSTCSITGITTTNPSIGGVQTFGNFTWNCPSQTTNTNLNSIFTVNGTFTLNSTGPSGIFRFAIGTTTINGNYSQTGGTNRLVGGTSRILNVGGNFSLSGGEFRISSGTGIGTINVKGNFSFNTGTLITETSTGNGTIVFNGISNQSLTGGGTISNDINFTINNSTGITLSTPITLPAALTMTSGNIALNGKTLTLGTSTARKGVLNWTSGFFTGSGTFTRWFSTSAITLGNVLGLFPFGNATNNRNVWIWGTPTTGGTMSVSHTDATGTTAILPFTENSQTFNKRTNMSWTLSNANGFAGTSLSLRIQGSGITGINSVSDLNICLASTVANGAYSAPGGTTANPQVNRTGLTQANLVNTFYFAATSGSPLPVELSSFSAVILENGIKINWRTETEVNNYGFEIERKILKQVQNDNTVWEKIGFINGNGNSNSPKNYSFADNSLTAGKYSYRLKQIDNDGQFEYSPEVAVEISAPVKFTLNECYPNPFNNTTMISWQQPVAGFVTIKIFDVLGNEVATIVNENSEAGKHNYNFNATMLSSGMYIVRLQSGGFVNTKKMVLLK